ncbi:hypothetical protein HY463_00680 [Candidatus Peregrinibacteria bacterium]|nr:hypothetical protein [Candidatus Peregrinibacteria bacterium]
MKKILLILAAAILLSSCGAGKMETVVEAPAESSTEISWNAISVRAPGWNLNAATNDSISFKDASGIVAITKIDNTDSYTVFEKINIADQNYKLVSKTEPVVLTTNWEGQDLLIEGSAVEFADMSTLLSGFSISSMTWQNYSFKRPSGMDWYAFEDVEGQHLIFVPDDGDFLENETWTPDDIGNQLEDAKMPLHVLITTDSTKINRDNAKYYKEATFNSVTYEIARFEVNGHEYVQYKSKVGDKYLDITALKAYDSPAQNILNKIIGL